MHRPVPPSQFWDFYRLVSDQEFDGQDDQGQDKKEQGDPVDAVHVPDKT